MKIDWFPLAIPELLGWSLLHSLWQFVLLAGFYWLLLRFRSFHIPHYRYLAGLLVLLLMGLCFSATLWYEYRIWMQTAEPTSAGTSSIPLSALVGQTVAPRGGWVNVIGNVEKGLPYLVNGWFIGVAFYLFRLAGNFAALQQIKRRSSMPLPKWIHERAREYGRRMEIRLPVSVRVSGDIEVPMVFAMLRPVVLIPASLVSGMPPAQLEAILAHELAHIKRQDFTINLCQSFLEMIFFYHPAFWWVKESVREAREQAADDLAINTGANSSELAHALAYIVNQASGNAPELAMAAQKSTFPTLLRIQRMMGMQPSKIIHSPLISKTMMITSVLSFILLLGIAQQEDPHQERWLETNFIDAMNPLPLPLPTSPSMTAINPDSLPASSSWSQQVDREIEMDTAWNLNTVVELDSLPEILEWNIPSPPVLTGVPPFPDAALFVPNGFMEDFGDSIRIYTSKIVQFDMDSTPDGLAQKEKFEQKMQEFQQKMTATQKVFQEKIKEWEAAFKPKMEEFEAKMEAWSKQNEPKIREFEAKMEEWGRKHEAKLKAMEEKMREREKAMEKIREEKEARDTTLPDR